MAKRDDKQAQEETDPPAEPKFFEGFNGFKVPQSNYFRMPNEWIDICSNIETVAELKVVQYILRHTWGYREYDKENYKTITTDEFMYGRKRKDGSRIDKGTGLSKKSVVKGIKDAIQHKLIKCEVDDRDKGRIVKSYVLIMEEQEENDEVRCVDSTHLTGKIRGGESTHLRGESTHLRGESTHRTEKETKERNLEKGKEDTAHAPNGSVLPSSPSPVSTHKEGRPRSTNQTSKPEPTPSKQKCTPKESVDPDILEQAKSTMEREIGGRVIWESQYVRSVKEIIRSGGTCEEIQTVIRRLKADKYHKDKVTVPYVIREFPNQLSQANLTISSDEPSTQEDTPPKFDANTDPRTLSNSDHIEWVSLYGPVKDTVLV